MQGGWIAATVAGLALGGALAAQVPSDDWMYPEQGPPPPAGAAPAPTQARRLPGSGLAFTTAQLRNLYEAVDWFPERHPRPPAIVLHGHPANAMACGFCHMPGGQGRPENAALAGLPAAYIQAQVAQMASGARRESRPGWTPGDTMRQIAAGTPAAEVAAAAAYFSALPYGPQVRVVEAQQIPAMRQAAFLHLPVPGGGREALGERIIETPDDAARAELRDPDARYTAYVPPGAVARGAALARTGGDGRTQPCGLCHGSRLKGGLGPPIAGRYPAYLLRQLDAFHSGARHGDSAAPMTAVTARLTRRDMIDLSAYAASLAP